MLLAEDPFDLLIERLRDLPAPDRQAILRRLSSNERRRVDTALSASSLQVSPGFAPDITARITGTGTGVDAAMTAATREVLMRIMGTMAQVSIDERPQGPSLFARLRDVFRRR